MIQTKVKEEIKKAMLEKNEVKLNTLRGVLASFINELVAKGKKPDEELADDDALAVIKRAVKQRRDSIEQFKKGGREDLAKQEEQELEVLNGWLPQMATSEEIKEVVSKKKEELNITDKSKAGMLVGAVMKEMKGNADGGEVKKIVEELLS
jgi:uncharacterized protein